MATVMSFTFRQDHLIVHSWVLMVLNNVLLVLWLVMGNILSMLLVLWPVMGSILGMHLM